MFYTSPLHQNGPDPRPGLSLLTAQTVRLSRWNFSDLRAPYWRLYWNDANGACIRCQKRQVPLTPERWVLVPPDTCFRSELHRPVTHFFVHFVTSAVWTSREPVALRTTRTELTRFRCLACGITDNASDEWEVLSLVAGCLRRLPESGWAKPTDPGQRIRSALQTMSLAFPRPVSIRSLSREAGMHLNAFIRLFREKTGMTPARYAREKRIEVACVLLHYGKQSIDEIAGACGFCDRYHFTRCFTASRGMPPGAFRRMGMVANETE